MTLPKPATLILISLLSLLMIRSLLEVSDNTGKPVNHWTTLAAKLSNLENKVTARGGNTECAKTDPALLREYAWVCWQSGDTYKAASIYHMLWGADTNGDTCPYNQQFVEDALNLAGATEAQGAFGHAVTAYENIASYEGTRLPKTDSRVVRDFNNLGVACYLAANAQTDTRERDQYYKKSFAAMTAAQIAAKEEQSPSMVSIIDKNREFLLRDFPKTVKP